MVISAPEPRQASGGHRGDAMIGIFGGTFDPVHNGHLRIALDALEMLRLAHLRLIPLAHAVHRDQPETPAELRLAMLSAAVGERPQLVVDDREIRRHGPSYTIDTLRELHTDFPQHTLCLLLGTDAFNGFASWRNPEGILDLANIAVLQRPGHPDTFAPAVRDILEHHHCDALAPGRHGQIVDCPVTQLDIASSDIRQRLAAGRSVDFLLPDAVLQLIRGHRLYGSPADNGGRHGSPDGLS